MNTKSTFDDDNVRREWEAQERAIHEERRMASTSDDVRVAQYRFIARALRHPPIDSLPANFAYRTAAWIEGLADVADDRFESTLQRALIVLMVIGSVGTMILFGNAWLPTFVESLPHAIVAELTGLTRWGAVIAVCLGVSWALGRWRNGIQGGQLSSL